MIYTIKYIKMNYKVYNQAAGNWVTYRRDSNGNYSEVHKGLPSYNDEPRCIYETEIRRDRRFKPVYDVYDTWNSEPMEYQFTEVETKTTKTYRDIFRNKYRQVVLKHRPVNTYRTELYLNY
jgi:hypothetical protein